MIGISTFPYIRMSLYEALARIEQLTDLAEVLSESRHNILLYGEVMLSFNLRYTIHAPITDINLSSIHPPLREAAIRVLEDVIRRGVELGAEVFVVHPGYIGWEADYELAREGMRRSLSRLPEIASEYGVTIAIENQPNREYLLFRTPEMLTDLGGLGFALDVGHANTVGMLEEFLKCEITHLHLHDNHGKDDEHLGIGSGTIEFRKVASATSDPGIMKILELRREEDVQDSFTQLKSIYGE
ncbi:MAG: sugar phosphate isomerase/epimerase [Candidatus Syntrophoarchaeum sp. WYZ-LMO15]|nr:MAG: sugar phosphate isomerase/epimerase [Candidatus Syntrophoarchaeum sp. WYZ-LMO15]